MKKIFFVLILICSFSCARKGYEFVNSETIYTDVYITEVRKAKYSKIEGTIYYNNIKMDIDNGNDGYYYKDYNLHAGDVVKRKVTIYQQAHYSNNPYKNDVLLSTSDVDFSDYVIDN